MTGSTRVVALLAALLAGGAALFALTLCENKEAARPQPNAFGASTQNPLLAAPDAATETAPRREVLEPKPTSPYVLNAHSAQTRAVTTQQSVHSGANSEVSWKDIRDKNYERIVSQYAGDAIVDDRKRYAIYGAVDEFNSLYTAMFVSLQSQLSAAARDKVTKRGSSPNLLRNGRYLTVGVTTGGLHSEVRVYESEYPHVFVTSDDLAQIPVKLHERITRIMRAGQ